MPGPVRIIAYGSAFAGLVLAIGPSFQGLDWRGLVLVAIGKGKNLLQVTGNQENAAWYETRITP